MPLPIRRLRALSILRYTLLAVASAVAFVASAGDSGQTRRTVSYSVTTGGRTVQSTAYIEEDVDESPRFPGGEKERLAYVNRNRCYPREAYEKRVEGRVLCSFIVSPEGTITNIEVVRSVERTLDAEAVRLIGQMPQWTPGKIEGNPVPVYVLLPIPFRL